MLCKRIWDPAATKYNVRFMQVALETQKIGFSSTRYEKDWSSARIVSLCITFALVTKDAGWSLIFWVLPTGRWAI